ncbi:dolichyl-diphosphooligosaccharide-protein glycosyltransferase [Coprinopsis cinerea okayama7|uniref:Dolichyl-diphosphooligosaccharide--protein glycosyltransferase subunit WBP1 n=1 Tax=Coprinopsis cinerea (strain Okayama-7 / 130 / ATCC MYA-4618 / FGSC 9003) TaxID=240176 RepID=A8P9U5_COPC7|nr:dolichyl-diphosphooligosaccharide-protein glycosyltransferase [Coprinopsis cinerea okayama7\|eukprot:XP_001839842.1 dolichyl-diphosphooligosaccharide-protein glycosyltransferase [Coprinopsis cinerea okayama7\
MFSSFRRLCLLALSLTFVFLVEAKSSTGDSVLVVVDPKRQDSYSLFFDDLKDRGYDLTYRSPKAETPLVIEDDVANFAHVIVLSAAKNYGKDLTPQTVVELLNQKTNVLVALSPSQTALTSLASEFSLILPPPGSPLISYFPKRDEPPTLIPISVPAKSSPVLSKPIAPVWFSGVPQSLGLNPFIVPILKAPAESFAGELPSQGGSAEALVEATEKGGEGLWAGSSLGVVTGFQTANGGRITWLGGADMLTDELFQKQLPDGSKPGNADFAREVTAWTFQESLVLRIDKVEHHLVNATEPKEQYTINDNIEFAAYISKWNPKKGTWDPCACRKDIQLEFTMLDPFIRTALPPVPGQPGKYATTFRAPDRHGVYKFIVDYKRKGWSFLKSSTTVPVVPPRHDGYPRFLSAAWPYYIGAISTSVAFFLFSAIWLAGDAREAKKSKGSKAE